MTNLQTQLRKQLQKHGVAKMLATTIEVLRTTAEELHSVQLGTTAEELLPATQRANLLLSDADNQLRRPERVYVGGKKKLARKAKPPVKKTVAA